MRKARINKGRKRFREYWGNMPVFEKVLIFVPMLVAIGLLCWLFFGPNAAGVQPSAEKANRELLLSTDGHWETFEDYGIDVWCPNNMTSEKLDDEVSNYQKLFVTRDKGNFPEIAFGVILAPDVDNRTFDLANDPSGVLDVTTPLLNEAFGKMINGAYPTTMTDIDQVTLANGQTALQGIGEASVTLVYQDPEDETNQWSEDTVTNIYYNVVIFQGRPVIVWGTWDYSTLDGEARTKAAVADGVTSIMRADDLEVLAPQEDTWNTQVDTYPEDNVAESTPEYTWNEASQQWVDNTTGEVVDLPPKGDPYWDDKQLSDAGEKTYGYEDGEGNWVATDADGNIIDDGKTDYEGPVHVIDPEESDSSATTD